MTMNDLLLLNLIMLSMLALVVLLNNKKTTRGLQGERGFPGYPGPTGPMGLRGHDAVAPAPEPTPAPAPAPTPARRTRIKFTRKGVQICLTKGDESHLFDSCVAADRFLIERELTTRIGCVHKKLKTRKKLIAGYLIRRVSPQQ